MPISKSEGTVVIGRLGDRWLDTMPYLRVERGQRNNKYGYLVTYEVPGSGAFTLFWSHDQIDFRGTSPTYRLNNMPLGQGTLYYPDRLTAQSLPDVYQAVQIIDQDYADEADGPLPASERRGQRRPRLAPGVAGRGAAPGELLGHDDGAEPGDTQRPPSWA